MDAVAFPPPPAPFLDDDFDFGDFTFASAPAASWPALAGPQPATFAAFDDDWGDFVASPLGSNPDASAPPTPPMATSASWEKPRGPLPLSLFGADDQEDDGREEEGPAGRPPTATAHQRAPSFCTSKSRPADLKDLIAGLYGSQPPSAASAVDADSREEPEDDDGFGDDGWEFKAATASPAAQEGGAPAHGDGIGEDIAKSLASDQEDWSSFTSVDEKLNHVQTTDLTEAHESTGQCVNTSSHYPANNAAILNRYRESGPTDAVHIMQNSTESAQSSSDLFSSNEMNSSFETDENHSTRSTTTSDSILIEFYHRLREESLRVISRHMKDLREAQNRSTMSDENSKAATVLREIQEIYEKLHDFSLPKGFGTEEHPSGDLCITELLNSIKEEHLKDFEQEYHLAERIALAMEDTSVALELHKHSVSTLHALHLASKEEQCDYIGAWYSMLLSCAQELRHGAVFWQESCHANICDRVISEGGHCFIALGELYRVARILYFSLQCFKPWVLVDPGMLSKMVSCLDICSKAWTSGLETAVKMVVDSAHLDASVAKALMESIKNINELEVSNLQNSLPNNEITCRLTLLPASLLPGMKVIMWNGDHYFVKAANLWANRISSDPPQLSQTLISSMN